MSAVGAPDIERGLRLSHTATSAVLFVVPGVVGLVLEPFVFLMSDRIGRAWLVRAGLAVMALMSFVAAIAPGPVTLACALAVSYVASGAATSLSEVTLIDCWPEHRARTMARWSLLAVVGDIAAPILLGGLAVLAGGRSQEVWRTGFAIVGAALGAWAIATSLRSFPAAQVAPGEDAPPLWKAVREAMRDRVLIAWMLGMELCNLLDEIFIVFASIHVRDDMGASAAAQSTVVGAFIAGGVLGLLVFERLLLRYTEHQLMMATGVACAVSFVAWLAAPTVWLSALLMVPVGATSAPLYPLATAQAYARCPGRSSVVLVASHLFTPLALGLPWLLGMVADRAGALTALALLVAQPVGLVALATLTSRAKLTTGDRDSRGSRTDDAP